MDALLTDTTFRESLNIDAMLKSLLNDKKIAPNEKNVKIITTKTALRYTVTVKFFFSMLLAVGEVGGWHLLLPSLVKHEPLCCV